MMEPRDIFRAPNGDEFHCSNQHGVIYILGNFEPIIKVSGNQIRIDSGACYVVHESDYKCKRESEHYRVWSEK